MEFKGNQSQPNTNRQAVTEPRMTPPAQLGQRPTHKLHMAVVAVLVVAVVAGLALWWWKGAKADMAVMGDRYQALFLTNGQVYFCKLSNVSSTYVTCKDIYYLQVQQSVQPAQNNQDQQPQVSLAKLGSELHGPEDAMHVNREQVLFWENLKNDSKVVKAIKDNQNK